jgi:lipid-A-disaccharide synthase
MDKEVVKELIQKELTTDNLKKELSLISFRIGQRTDFG